MSASPANPPEQSTAESAALLEVRNVAKRFGAVEVLKNIFLNIASGEFITLLGESGSGKTTLLRLIAGFEQPSAGEIWMSGERLDHLPPYKRRVNTVFQNYALFPHLSARDNVAYGLRVRNIPASEISGRVEEALRMVKMQDFASYRPSKLSGGQQQRIALARALVNRPQLLLLDEPLSALDANLRKQMQSELKSLQREIGITFLFVTHDQEEAMALSDRIALLRDGALEQVAAPREIYAHPATAYTAQFIGQTNLLRGEIRGCIVTCGALRWPTEEADGLVIFSLRPEAIRICADGRRQTSEVKFRAAVRQQFYGGSSELLEVDCGNGQTLRVRVTARGPLTGEHDFVFSLPGVATPSFMYSRAYKSVVSIPPLLWVGAFLLLPYALMFAHSFWAVPQGVIVHQWNWGNYKTLFTNPLYAEVLFRTMRIAASVTLCSLLLGYPLAYYLAFHARKKLLYQLVIVPLWVSYLVRGYAWKTILGSDGVLNGFLQYFHLTHGPVGFFLYSPFAVVLLLTHIYTPFVFLPIYASLEHIPRPLVEASQDLGAGSVQTFLRVILPLSMPGLLAGATFAFVLSLGDFLAPLLVGGPSGTMIANVVQSLFGAAFDWPLGAAISVGILVITISLLFLSESLEKRWAFK